MPLYKVSVIIPSYKPGNYIWDCLDSLILQTLPKEDFEIILVLNGCCEPWKNQIESFIIGSMKGFTIKLIQTDKPGVSNARNLGIDSARGEYISFIDDDDFVSPQYLEELYKLSDDDTLALSYQLAFKDGSEDYFPSYITKEYDKNSNKRISYYKARRFFNGPVYKLIPRHVIAERRFNTSFSNGEDALFMFLISDKFNKVTFTSKDAIYFRRYRNGSAISLRGSRIDKAKNSMRLISNYFNIYIHNPFKYNVSFLLSRILGSLKIIIQ